MKFSFKDFFSQCDQIHKKQLDTTAHNTWTQLKKSLMESFIFCVVSLFRRDVFRTLSNIYDGAF